MTEVNRTIVVKALDVLEARQIAEQFPGGTGMFMTPKTTAPDGKGPVTHFLVSGWLDEAIVGQFEFFNAQYGVTKYEIVDIEFEGPFATFARLGLFSIYEEA